MSHTNWTPPGPTCPRCGGNVIPGSDLHGGVVIDRGLYAGQTRHRLCSWPTEAEKAATGRRS